MQLARPERLSPRSAVGDPAGAVAESLSAPRCRNVLPRGRAVVDLPTTSGVRLPRIRAVGRCGIAAQE